MPQQEILQEALRLLSRKMYSTEEVRNKLFQQFPKEDDKIEWTLSECLRLGFLHDERFAKEYVRYRQQTSPRSVFVLQRELSEKGISLDITKKVLNEEEDENTAQHLAERKWGNSEVSNEKEFQKRIRFLMSRGFSFSVAKRAAGRNVL